MSRQRKQNRDRRRGLERLHRMVRIIAEVEGRSLNDASDVDDYRRELMRRGVIVDLGPHPSGRGRHLSFRFEHVQGLVPLTLIAEWLQN